MIRRNFLASASVALVAKLDAHRLDSVFRKPENAVTAAPLPVPGSPPRELDFASALRAADAIRRKKVSSVELTHRVFERIDRYNGRLNDFAYQLREEALVQARKADEAQSRGGTLGIFHGVPVNVKESFGVAGHPCTWGLEALRDSNAPGNSVVVERLLGAGAVLIGATNVPVSLWDWQSYNSIYGTTNNPWDVKRTPGGSSGGSAAALAAGLGYLSVGSDIGGSIRVPSHFCGIYGHKPSLDLVSLQGHAPGGVVDAPGFSTLLAVGGPMARSAGDLLAALKVLGGPVGWDAKAWKWELPPPRGQNLREFRVGYVLDDPIAPPTPEVGAVLEKVIQSLDRAGTKLRPGWPPGVQAPELLRNYLFLLQAFAFSVASPEEQQARRKELAESQSPEASAALSSFADWQRQNFRRLQSRAQWQAYFDLVDVFLSPVAFSAAFPHDHSEPMARRTIATPRGPRPYFDMFNWIAPSTLTGCPATVAPVGRTAEGLPVGVQIMGPYWEDATPITFADLLSRELGGFAAPPGYSE
jgi:amidase